MSKECVLLTIENNCANIFFLYFTQYPTKKAPRVNDKLMLQAQTTMKTRSKNTKEAENIEITYLSGEYVVIRVIEGNGSALIPELADGNICTLSKDVVGFGVQIRKIRDLALDEKPIIASVALSTT